MPNSCVNVTWEFRQVGRSCCFLALERIDNHDQIGRESGATVQIPAVT